MTNEFYGKLKHKSYKILFNYTQAVYEEFCKIYNETPIFRYATFPVELQATLEYENNITVELSLFNVDTFEKIQKFHEAFQNQEFILFPNEQNVECHLGEFVLRCNSVSYDNPKIEQVVNALNNVFNKDPSAISALIRNRVPCNQELKEENSLTKVPILLFKNGEFTEHYMVGALGLINLVLQTLGLPEVAFVFGDGRANGREVLCGFKELSVAEELVNSKRVAEYK